MTGYGNLTMKNDGRHFVLKAAFLCFAVLVSPNLAHAQTLTTVAETGFQPNRDYLALQPFETIDTLSGNIVLTFTDLTLPANGGRALTFTRTYNSLQTGPNKPHWFFGISGIPLRATVDATNATIPVNQQIAGVTGPFGEHTWAPSFLMPDGSTQYTTFMNTPDTSSSTQILNTTRWVSTPAFWRYDRIAGTLYLPDGRVAQYDTAGRLRTISDPAGSTVNTISLMWEPSLLTVTQSLGHGQTRQITVEMNDNTLLPERMIFGQSTWQYSYAAAYAGALETVQLPDGIAWLFEYQGELLTRLTTPQGGTIRYTYDFFTQDGFPPPDTLRSIFALSTRNANSGSGEQTWRFSYKLAGTSAAPYSVGAVVTLPSGQKIDHTYVSTADQFALSGGTQLVTRVVTDLDGMTEIETEGRHYTSLKAARPNVVWYGLEIQTRRITRNGRTYTTEYQYTIDANTLDDYHRVYRIIETGAPGELSRTTTFDYQHLNGPLAWPYILGLVTQEDVLIGGQTSSRSWTYDTTTSSSPTIAGFRRSETVNGITTQLTPDALGNVATITKANEKSVSFAYSYGQVSQTSTPGVLTTRVINPDGTVQSETSAGRTTSYEYDALGRVKVTRPPGVHEIRTVYSANSIVTTRGDSKVTTTLDGFGRPIATLNNLDVRTRTEYDAEGRKVYESLPFVAGFGEGDVGTRFTYDGLGRVTREEPWRGSAGLSAGNARTRTYVGNSIILHDENGHDTTLIRQAFGHPDDVRLTGVIDANDPPQQWTYSYNVVGRLTSVTGPGGVTRTWAYHQNNPNLLVTERHPEFAASTAATYDYDVAGMLKHKTDPNGNVFTYNYDDDRLTSIQASGVTTTITYESGSNNRQTISVSDGSSTTFTYEPTTGRLASRSDSVDGKPPFVVNYVYDFDDNLRRIVYPSNRHVDNDVNRENQIVAVRNGHDGVPWASGALYHPSGALSFYRAGNNLDTLIGFDPLRYWVNSINVAPMSLNYSYDDVGNTTGITDARPNFNQTFTYDNLDRLLTATSPGNWNMQFAYDAHGNRQSVPGVSSYTYDPTNPFRLISVGNGPTDMHYDNNGNIFSVTGASMTYNANNQMVSFTGPGGTSTYDYDGDNWRVKKTVNGVTTYYTRGPNGQLLSEWINTSPTATVKDYIYAGSRLIAVVTAQKPAR